MAQARRAKGARVLAWSLCLGKVVDRLFQLEEFMEGVAYDVDPHFDMITNATKRSMNEEKPLSIFSVVSFIPKIESIRLGIFDLAKAEGYYSINILHRSLIEHYTKAIYLWIKTIENTDDEVGIDYWVFGTDKEVVDYAKALSDSYTLLGIANKESPNETLKRMGFLDGDKSITKIKNKTQQFSYKNMVKYISTSTKMREKGVAPIINKVFPMYSELSSCVHGGPESVGAYEKGLDSLAGKLEFSVFSSLSVTWLSYELLSQYEEAMRPLCQVSANHLFEYLNGGNQSE